MEFWKRDQSTGSGPKSHNEDVHFHVKARLSGEHFTAQRSELVCFPAGYLYNQGKSGALCLSSFDLGSPKCCSGWWEFAAADYAKLIDNLMGSDNTLAKVQSSMTRAHWDYYGTQQMLMSQRPK